MAASRWLVCFMGVVTLGEVTLDKRQSDVQLTPGAEDLPKAGLCAVEPEHASPREGASEQTAQTSAPSSERGCPSDMVEVQGQYCQVVEQICEDFISEKKDRCAKYRNKVRCFGKTTNLHFCVDRFEYPNRAGEKPTVAVSYTEAKELCAAEGKRLCTADEWTQACEGTDHQPYPYGFVRNSDACNHDKPYIIPNDPAYQDLSTRAAEIARLDQSEPSGARPECVSPYGVFDMTGNVDEWVYNEAGSPQGPEFESALKGGYWGPVRNRCRPMTTDHNHWHHGYQIGFRCCADPNAGHKLPHSKEPTPRSVPEKPDLTAELGRS